MGDEDLFYQMLELFEDMTMINLMSLMAIEVEKLNNGGDNFKEFQSVAHTLKGACANVAAGPMHMACFYIQKMFHDNQHDQMIKYYPDVIKAIVDFRIYSR